jgi:hypothetical protein
MPPPPLIPTSCPTEEPGSRSKNKGDLVIEVEGDKHLFNQYGVMLVNPQKHPHVKKELGQQFIDWLVSPETKGNRRLQGQWRAIVLSERE